MSDHTNVSDSSHTAQTSPNPVQALFESAYDVGENVVNDVRNSFHTNKSNPITAEALFKSAYDVGENVVKEVRKGSDPICSGIAKRIEEDPTKSALHGAGFLAAGALVYGVAVAESPVIIGIGSAAAVISILGVGAYEAIEQSKRIGKEWSENGVNILEWRKLFINQLPYDNTDQKF